MFHCFNGGARNLNLESMREENEYIQMDTKKLERVL